MFNTHKSYNNSPSVPTATDYIPINKLGSDRIRKHLCACGPRETLVIAFDSFDTINRNKSIIDLIQSDNNLREQFKNLGEAYNIIYKYFQWHCDAAKCTNIKNQ